MFDPLDTREEDAQTKTIRVKMGQFSRSFKVDVQTSLLSRENFIER